MIGKARCAGLLFRATTISVGCCTLTLYVACGGQVETATHDGGGGQDRTLPSTDGGADGELDSEGFDATTDTSSADGPIDESVDSSEDCSSESGLTFSEDGGCSYESCLPSEYCLNSDASPHFLGPVWAKNRLKNSWPRTISS